MALPRLDPYLENKENYVRIDELWLSNLVDIFDSAMKIIEDNLISLDERITSLGG